jgi:endonuclease G
MKKTILLISLLIFSWTIKAQEVVVIKHTNYTSTFSKTLEYPLEVEWWETKAKDGCPVPLKRKDQFQADPVLPKETDLMKDYVGSGYDRGHMCPAASNLCSGDAVQKECFYFSNMAPQTHSNNAGDWKSLEVLTRKIALEKDSVHVWCGNVGVLMKIGKVSVPTKCWKVIYIKKDNEYRAYIFENDRSKPNGIEDNRVPIEAVEKLTGYSFK